MIAKQVRFDSGSDLSEVDIHRIVLESTDPSQHAYRPLHQAELPISSDTTPHRRWKARATAPKRVVVDSATQRSVPTTSISRSAFPAAPNAWVVKRFTCLLERALDSTAEEIEEATEVEAARKELS